MKLTVVVPVVGSHFVPSVREESIAWANPSTEISVIPLEYGPTSIESEYDEALAVPEILKQVAVAQQDGADAVFVTCFADPGVHPAREIVDIPVVGGFEPAILTALSLGEHIGIVTVIENTLPMLRSLIRRYGLAERVTAIENIDLPVLELVDTETMTDRLEERAKRLIEKHGIDVIVLGCTGMIGVAQTVQRRIADSGAYVPVVDPTGAAIAWLENLHKLGVRPSKTTYMSPPEKTRMLRQGQSV